MRLFKFLLPFLFISSCLLSANEKEERLINHVQQCIEKAEREDSKLKKKIFALEGMSSNKMRCLLNNLCTLPGTNYLEIGCWHGSTLISALYKNNSSVTSAIAMENWSEYGGPKARFQANVEKWLGKAPFLKFYETDCFKVNKAEVFTQPITLYLYDGDHSTECHEQAFTYFDEVFDEVFIALVDDWNVPAIREGTQTAFTKLNYKVLYEKAFYTDKNGDKSSWWNGLYIAVLKKKASSEDPLPDQIPAQ